MSRSNESSVTSIPSEAIQKVFISNYQDVVEDITDLVYGFSIYEHLMKPTSSCEILLADAKGLPQLLPIIGDEKLTIHYRTRGVKTNNEQYETRKRAFQVYKLDKLVESAERQHNYVLHGVDDHFIMNEMIDLNQSFVGQNCVKAIESIFKSNFIKNINDEFRPFTIYEKLNGLERADVIESTNSSFYISPGVTPFEAIAYLKEEAEHKNFPTNNSDFVFYQDYQGFHLTTLSELKNQPAKYSYTVKDMAAESDNTGRQVGESQDTGETDDMKTVIDFEIKKTFDSIHHLGLGTYGNRVAAIDLLTKQFDEKSFSYSEEYRTLNPMDQGRLISDKSLYRFSGSTHTRYLPTELLSNSIPTGVPTGFNNSIANYSQTPYFYPIDGQGKEEGTISNEDANKRLQEIIQKDPKIANPRRKHYSLNKKVSGIGILDTIIVDIKVPGNSDIKVGDTINFYLPQTSADIDDKLYNMFFGQKDPKFLVVKLNQKFVNEVSSYYTLMTIVKDSFKDEVATIMKKRADSLGEPTEMRQN